MTAKKNRRNAQIGGQKVEAMADVASDPLRSLNRLTELVPSPSAVR